MRVPGLVPGMSQMDPRMLAETGQEQQARTAALRRVLQQRQQGRQGMAQAAAPLATAGMAAAGVPAPVAQAVAPAAVDILGELVGALG